MRHLIKYVLRYPQGHVPKDWEVPEGYVPEGCIEDYDLSFAAEAPEVGQTFDAWGDSWKVAQIQTYQRLGSIETALESFHIAVCTQDGCVPVREPWHSSKPPLLVIHALSRGELATNEDGSCYYELVEREDWITPFQGWEIQTLQHFEPVGERLPGDHDKVIVAWSLSTVELDEHSGQKAA